MLTCMQGITLLRQLRLDWEEDAGDQFPDAVLREMLVLYDVCKILGLNLFQCQEVLGDVGWRFVKHYLDQPVYQALTANPLPLIAK